MQPNQQRRRRRKGGRRLNKIVTIVIGASFLIFIIYGIAEDLSFKKNRLLTTGIITDYNISENTGKLSFDFSYEVDGKKYNHAETQPNVYNNHAHYFIGKQFPVAYKKNDVERCRILMTTYDFSSFWMNFPDSLKWVRKYER